MADKEADASWALKLLESEYNRERSLVAQWAGVVLGGCAGLASAFFINYGSGRPPLSGIQKHLTLPFAGVGVMYLWKKRVDNSLAERDAVYRHYISLHPEDFPEPVRRKYSEILMPWVPYR